MCSRPCARWPGHRGPTCSAPGRASGTTAGPSRCIARPRWSWPSMAVASRRTVPTWSVCPASAPTPRRRSLRSRVGEPVAAIDVNARRIVARVAYGRDVSGVPTGDIDATAAMWVDRRDPGAWNQALMDLGREHCRAVPRCEGCPLAGACRFVRVWSRAGAGCPEAVPVRGIDASGARRGGRCVARATVGRCRGSRADHRVRHRSDHGGARWPGARRGGSALGALVSAPGLMRPRSAYGVR